MELTPKNRLVGNRGKPVFPSASDHEVFSRLREEVTAIVQDLKPLRERRIKVKAVVFPMGYLLTYGAALYFSNYKALFFACYFLLGLELVFLFLNVIHDAAHGTIFLSKEANDRYLYLFDLMGANSYMWRLRHVRFLHNYPM